MNRNNQKTPFSLKHTWSQCYYSSETKKSERAPLQTERILLHTQKTVKRQENNRKINNDQTVWIHVISYILYANFSYFKAKASPYWHFFSFSYNGTKQTQWHKHQPRLSYLGTGGDYGPAGQTHTHTNKRACAHTYTYLRSRQSLGLPTHANAHHSQTCCGKTYVFRHQDDVKLNQVLKLCRRLNHTPWRENIEYMNKSATPQKKIFHGNNVEQRECNTSGPRNAYPKSISSMKTED